MASDQFVLSRQVCGLQLITRPRWPLPEQEDGPVMIRLSLYYSFFSNRDHRRVTVVETMT
jgi:hypothetical protein